MRYLFLNEKMNRARLSGTRLISLLLLFLLIEMRVNYDIIIVSFEWCDIASGNSLKARKQNETGSE